MEPYSIIYADPPWEYPKSGGTKSSVGLAKKFYKTMPIEQIGDLRVGDIAAENSALFLWATWPRLPAAIEVMRCWGFTYFGLGFEWIKKTVNGKDCIGMGYWTRANSEPCLLGFRGKMQPLRHDIRQIVEAERREHSRKPAIVRDKIVALCGDLPRIELFARESVRGWDCWGDEVSHCGGVYNTNPDDIAEKLATKRTENSRKQGVLI